MHLQGEGTPLKYDQQEVSDNIGNRMLIREGISGIIKCLFGLHRWYHTPERGTIHPRHWCIRCGKSEYMRRLLRRRIKEIARKRMVYAYDVCPYCGGTPPHNVYNEVWKCSCGHLGVGLPTMVGGMIDHGYDVP